MAERQAEDEKAPLILSDDQEAGEDETDTSYDGSASVQASQAIHGQSHHGAYTSLSQSRLHMPHTTS